MWNRSPVKYSPCEIDYLKEHITDPLTQLAGYLGKSINSIKNQIVEIKTGVNPGKRKSGKRSNLGKRADLNGLFLRSGWEADMMRYFQHIKVSSIDYEPKIFSFMEFGIKSGTLAYIPDFFVQGLSKKDAWVEVKGFLKAEDKVKLRRFKKYYPAEFEKLVFVTGSANTAATKFAKSIGITNFIYFLEIKKKYKDIIPHWES